MGFLKILKNFLGFSSDSSFTIEKKIIITETGYKNMSRKNYQISEHVSFFDLTRTDHQEFIDDNRTVTDEECIKLSILASKVEEIIKIIGYVDIHSGRRCKKLNDEIGSTDKSQHLLCEAVDLSPLGPDSQESLANAFNKIIVAARKKEIEFGQLIMENAKRSYGREYWIHISTKGSRPKEKCGQVLTMIDGKYTLIETIV